MKKILLSFIFALSGFSLYSQATCATATTITANGNYQAGTIVGTYPTETGLCFTVAPPAPAKANWFKFTPASGGVLTVSSDIAANPASIDSRIAIYSGTCGGAFTCIAYNDDIGPADNYRSTVSNVVLTSGVTYYLVWDNRWEDTAFSFDFTFTAQSCFSPTGFTYTAPATATTVSLGWTAPVGGTTPVGYQVEYGVRGFTQGTGTVLNPTTNSVALSGLTASTVYAFYIRANCGASSYSVWSGPITFTTLFLPVNAPYTTGFEDTSFGNMGWARSGAGAQDWFLNEEGIGSTLVQGGAWSAVAISSATSPANNWMFSRGINLTANSPTTVTYWIRNYLAGGSLNVASYQLRVGNDQTSASQNLTLWSESSISSATFALQTITFTPTTTGVYYFGFLHNSAANATGTHALIVDTFGVTQTLSNNEFVASKFSMYPNPSNGIVNISNSENILFETVNVTDINGRIVKSLAFDNVSEISFNVSELNRGVYFVNISSDRGNAVKKLIVN